MSIFNGTMKFCRNVAGNGGKESIASEFVRVLDGSYGNFNKSGKGMAMFCGNMAASEGGGIKSADDSDIITLPLVHVCGIIICDVTLWECSSTL